jgi:hypothetical protein
LIRVYIQKISWKIMPGKIIYRKKISGEFVSGKEI